jgi:flagellin
MPLAISTNIAAEKANYYLGYNADKVQESIKRLASGKRLTSPVQDPGNLAVSMKLSASLNRLAGAMNNAQNGISFLEVQDGMLETTGKILDRMSELKGLATQDPMKSEMDKFSYNNEFKDLQLQLYAISQEQFNGVSLFANHTSESTVTQARFNGMEQSRTEDNTISIHTSQNGSGGAKVSLHRSLLLSALTLRPTGGEIKLAGEGDTGGDDEDTGYWLEAKANNSSVKTETNAGGGYITLAVTEQAEALSLGAVSVGVFIAALENVSFLRAQNGGAGSRLHFAYENIAQQRTNMRAALGRMVDVDIAEETTRLATYNVLSQGAASMIAQANATTDLALILLR